MGGYGSGRWNGYPKKYTVEDSLTLDLARLYKTGWIDSNLLKQRVTASGSLSWINSRTKAQTASIGVRIDTTTDNPHLRLIYVTKLDGQVIANTDEMVRLSYTSLNYGNRRVWLHCPECDARTRTLHNPPNSSRFLCRDCHDLTYTSVQTAHHDDRGKYAALGMLFTLEGKVQDTLTQLRQTRGNSKAKRRLQAKLDEMYQGFDTYLERAQATRNALADFDKLWNEAEWSAETR